MESSNISVLINTRGYQNPIAEIIGTWSSGIWYWDVATSSWTQMYSGLPSAAIAAGDFTADGKADVASIWSSGLWFQNGDSLGWTQVYHTAPDRVAAGDISGDGVDEIIGCGGASPTRRDTYPLPLHYKPPPCPICIEISERNRPSVGDNGLGREQSWCSLKKMPRRTLTESTLFF